MLNRLISSSKFVTLTPDINNRKRWGERVRDVSESLYSLLAFPVNLKLLRKKWKTITFFFFFVKKEVGEKAGKIISEGQPFSPGFQQTKIVSLFFSDSLWEYFVSISVVFIPSGAWNFFSFIDGRFRPSYCKKPFKSVFGAYDATVTQTTLLLS